MRRCAWGWPPTPRLTAPAERADRRTWRRSRYGDEAEHLQEAYELGCCCCGPIRQYPGACQAAPHGLPAHVRSRPAGGQPGARPMWRCAWYRGRQHRRPALRAQGGAEHGGPAAPRRGVPPAGAGAKRAGSRRYTHRRRRYRRTLWRNRRWRPAAKLRIGFMSSHRRPATATYFAMPLLEGFDRDRVEVFCYSFYERERDRTQAHIEQQVTGFRWWPRKPSAEVAAGIADDRPRHPVRARRLHGHEQARRHGSSRPPAGELAGLSPFGRARGHRPHPRRSFHHARRSRAADREALRDAAELGGAEPAGVPAAAAHRPEPPEERNAAT